MTKKIAILYGLGGSMFDPAAGEALLTTRCKGLGLDTGDSPYSYDASQAVYDFLKDADWCGIVGDSFGADYGPQYAGNLSPKTVNFLGGFQPSMYANDVRIGADGVGEILVPRNVAHARVFRDPLWAQTGGLGWATWVAMDPQATDLKVLPHYGAHPDDSGFTQGVMFADIQYFLEHP